MLRLVLAITVAAGPTVSPPAAEREDCARELASARTLYASQRATRLRLVEPLARTVRHTVEEVLTDADRELLARFARGEVRAGDVDRALWPKLHPTIDRFNRSGCKDLGGVVRAEEVVEASTALGGGKGLHTGVVVTCARRPLQGEARRFLGLRVRSDERGPRLALYGFVQERGTVFAAAADAEWSGLVVTVPLGDRAAEARALDAAVAAYTGTEDDFTWTVPPACQSLVSLAPPRDP
jgi:hypothetical protein